MSDQRVREAVEAVVARLRQDVESHLQGISSEMVRLVGELRDELTREGDARVAAERVDRQTAIDELKTEHGVAMAAAASDRDRLLTAANAERDWIAAEAKAEGDRMQGEVRADAEKTAQARVDAMKAELETQFAKERAELDAASAAEKLDAREDTLETFRRLLETFRLLDQADSLSRILELLARGAAAEASRVAILVVQGDKLRSWGHFGFSAGQGPFDIFVGPTGMLAQAMAQRRTLTVPAAAENESAAPAFMRVPAGHVGMVAPIVVGGEVVAVMYADGADREADRQSGSTWKEAVELLVRHAALRLETLMAMARDVFARPT